MAGTINTPFAIRTSLSDLMLMVDGSYKQKKNKLISFKGSEHIIEKGDGPYRGFGLLKSRQCVDYVWLPL